MGTHNSFEIARAPNTYNTVIKCYPAAKAIFLTKERKKERRKQQIIKRIENLPLFLVMKHELCQA